MTYDIQAQHMAYTIYLTQYNIYIVLTYTDSEMFV